MNGHETEVKFFVNNLEQIETRLCEMKAHLIQGRVHEINLRFDNANNDLQSEFKVLRLRKDTEARFTFKGPNQVNSEDVTSRMEIECTVSDFDSAKQFLEALGFRTVAFYEKFRATYELNNVHVMLDEMPYGNFVEIEGEDVSLLRAAARQLGLKWEASVKTGYLALFTSAARALNLDPSQLSFDALKSIPISAQDLGVEAAD
ncbi:MAG: class IV adenylate cyclase [Chloroflexi bacterium]|nr:class IV adenylate cyclase [Chloroflexota bacterium]